MLSDKKAKLLTIFALCLLGAVMLLLAAASWGIVRLSGFVNFLEDGHIVLRILMGVLFVALFVGVVAVIAVTARIGKGPKRSEMNLLKQNTDGASYITSDAVSVMTQRLVKKNRQIKAADCKVTPVEDGITLDVRLTAFTGVDLAELCRDVQSTVRREIESNVGIPVRNVSVSIVKTIETQQEAQPVKRVN